MRLTPFAMAASLAFAASTTFALVSGKVINRAGAPLPGVSVRQILTGDADTTDTQGAWSLGTLPVGRPVSTTTGGALLLRANTLRVVLEQASPISVEALSLDGRRIPLLETQGRIGVNDLVLDPSAVRPGGLLRIRTDRGTSVIAALSRLGSDRSEGAGAFRAAAVLDTLVFEKAGFERVVRSLQGGQDTFLVTMDSVLAAPQGLWTSVVSASANSIAWSVVPGATGYAVRRCAAAGGSCADTAVANPGFVQNGLSAGSTLRVRVQAVQGVRTSAWSEELLVHRAPLAPLSRGKAQDILPAFALPGKVVVTIPGWRSLKRVRAYSEATPFQDTVLVPDSTLKLLVGTSQLPVFDTAWIRVVAEDSLGDTAACRIRVTEKALVVEMFTRDTTVPFGTTDYPLRLQADSKWGIASVIMDGSVVTGTAGAYVRTVPLGVGYNSFEVEVRDLAGAAHYDTVQVRRQPDAIPPVIVRGTIPASPLSWVKTAQVAFSIADNDSLVSVTINGVAATRTGSSFTSTLSLDGGANPVVVLARDRTGNTAKDSLSLFTFLKDHQGNDIRIGKMPDGKLWTLQNLQTIPHDSTVPEGGGSACARDTCSKYGRLYTWTEAVVISSTNLTKSRPLGDSLARRGLCPYGWHMPTASDWKNLMRAAGAGAADSIGLLRLKSIVAVGRWYSWSIVTCAPTSSTTVDYSGTDTFGFTLLPSHAGAGAGQCGSGGSTSSTFWTATEAGAENGSVVSMDKAMTAMTESKSAANVVRCVAD